MSQLCRMTPKNCKINTQRLIRKLALEILSPYNTPESIGTTYRVYSDQAILERRRASRPRMGSAEQGSGVRQSSHRHQHSAHLCAYVLK